MSRKPPQQLPKPSSDPGWVIIAAVMLLISMLLGVAAFVGFYIL